MLRKFIKDGVGVEGDKLVTANPTISAVSLTLNQVFDKSDKTYAFMVSTSWAWVQKQSWTDAKVIPLGQRKREVSIM